MASPPVMAEGQTKNAGFEPLEFVPIFGTTFDPASFKGNDLILPTMSAGMNGLIGADLYILNEGATKVGYLKS